MTQKRGLGRGLGALIPGAGTQAAPGPELRTRTTTASADAERDPSPRPVDMFFSGEKAPEDERPARERAARRDLADGMARAAAERRSATRNGRPGRTGASPGTEAAAGSPHSPAEPTTPADESTSATAAAQASAGRTTAAKKSSGRSASKTSATAPKKSSASAPKKSSTTAAKKSSRSSARTSSGASTTRTPTTVTGAAADAATESTSTVAASEADPAAQQDTEAAAPEQTLAPTSRTDVPVPPDGDGAAGRDDAARGDEPANPAAVTADEPASEGTTSDEGAATGSGANAANPEEARPQGSAPAAEELAEDSPVVDVEQVEYTPARRPLASVTDLPAGSPADPVDGDDSADIGAEDSFSAEEGTTVEPRRKGRPAPDPAGTERSGLLPVPGTEFAEIPIDEIRENPRNPRTMFDEDELDELAFSLREVGMLQPVVVRPIPVTPDGESFELVMGERRWRAAQRAGLGTIPAIIRETHDDDLLRDALLENLHRSQLNPLEEANAYQQLLEDFGCTQDELGERIGRSRPQITNTLRLLRLPALVQRRLASGALSAGHARALLTLHDPALMEELAQRIVAEGLSVRAVERLVARGGQTQNPPRAARRSTYDPHVVDLTSKLSNRLETQVRIDVGKRKGRITVEFTNLAELERLVSTMGLQAAASADGTDPSEF